MSKVDQIVKDLDTELSNDRRKEVIIQLEEELVKNIEELSQFDNFFKLPLQTIFSIISKIDFDSIEENDENNKKFEITQKFIKKTIESHFDEKETILLLQNLDINQLSLSYEEYIVIFKLFTNCHFLVDFCNLYDEQNLQVDIDYDYELQKKDSLIKKLQDHAFLYSTEQLKERPPGLEPNIYKACKYGKIESVRYLIEKEQFNKNKKLKEAITSENISAGNAPIHIATQFGHLAIVAYLCDKGADKLIKNPSGNTILHIAAKIGYLQIVQYLIEKQELDVDIKTGIGETPLHYACQAGYQSIVKYLLYQGANIEESNNDGLTPIFYACIGGYLEIVELLISKGAKITTPNKNGDFPIHVAIKNKHLAIVKYFIEKQQVNIELQGANKKTPLQIVCFESDFIIASYLITHGANIEAINPLGGYRPLHYAARNNNITIVNLLLSKGADKMALTNDGKRAYDLTTSSKIKYNLL